MIFSRSGVPYPEWLRHETLAIAERLYAYAVKGRRHYLMNADGTRAYRVVYDKLGDPIRIYRDVTLYVRGR